MKIAIKAIWLLIRDIYSVMSRFIVREIDWAPFHYSPSGQVETSIEMIYVVR